MSNPKDNSPPWGALGGKIWKAVRPSTECEIYTLKFFPYHCGLVLPAGGRETVVGKIL